MTKNLTDADKETQTFFTLILQVMTNKINHTSMYAFESQFHQAMQKATDGVIKFDGINRALFTNKLLGYLADYFTVNGEHLFDKPIEVFSITNMRLSGLFLNIWKQLPSGVPHIVKLIEKNPNIKKIDLSYTQLNDSDARLLLNALKTNSRLVELKLDGNNISEFLLKKINDSLNSCREVRKNARLLGLLSKPSTIPTSMFALLPIEINAQIAALTGDGLNSAKAKEIVQANFQLTP